MRDRDQHQPQHAERSTGSRELHAHRLDDPAPRPPILRSTLRGRTVCLEPLCADQHASSLFAEARARGPELWEFLAYGPFGTEAELAEHLADQARSDDPLFFAVVPQEVIPSGPAGAAGVMSWLRIEPTHGTAEIGHIWLGASLARTTAATEAIYLLLSHAFDDLRYRRIEWKCDALNQASRQAALRFGFRFDGVWHRHRILRGRNRDTAWFSIVEEEWPALRRAYQAWLAPDNFDERGRQRKPLEARVAGDSNESR